MIGSLHIAPEEMIPTSDERSQRPGSASRAASIGRAKGSPTMTRPLTFSRSTVSSSSTGSKRRPESRTTRPPSLRHSHRREAPGAVHQRTRREEGAPGSELAELAAHALDAGRLVVAPEAPGVQAGEQVVLAPHDALGHPGGPAGVEHDQVVAAAAPGCPHPSGGALGPLLVGDRPLRARTRAVVHPQPAPDPGHPGRGPARRARRTTRGRPRRRRRRCPTGRPARRRRSGSWCSPGRGRPWWRRTSTRGTRGCWSGRGPPCPGAGRRVEQPAGRSRPPGGRTRASRPAGPPATRRAGPAGLSATTSQTSA